MGLAAIDPVADVMGIDEARGATTRYVSRHITGFMWRTGLCGGNIVRYRFSGSGP
jgi:hypothetical protein